MSSEAVDIFKRLRPHFRLCVPINGVSQESLESVAENQLAQSSLHSLFSLNLTFDNAPIPPTGHRTLFWGVKLADDP